MGICHSRKRPKIGAYVLKGNDTGGKGKTRGKGTRAPRYAIFVDSRGRDEPVLISGKDYTRAEGQAKVANLRRGLKGMKDSGANTLIIQLGKQDTTQC